MMKTAVCLLSVVPMRREPSHRSEMVSQVLFGEYVDMGEERGDFVSVKCLYDGYEGWVQISQLTPVTQAEVLSTTDYVFGFAETVFINGHGRLVPNTTPIYYPKKAGEKLVFGNHKISYQIPDAAVWKQVDKDFSKENLEAAIEPFLEAPYLWGGKSAFGIDCSGFAQQVFKLFGIKLLRDAYLQAGQGNTVETFGESRLGDLAFFQNEAGRITHVGIVLEENKIAHASGKVRIDTLDADGIVNNETGKRTHQFHSIRRFF